MSPLFQILFFVSTLIVVFASGKMVTRLLVASDSRFAQSQVMLPSLIGAGALVCCSVLLNYLGLPMKWVAILSLFPTIAGCWQLTRERVWKKITQGELFAAACAVLSGLFVIAPMLLYRSFNPYHDTFTYICLADYLIDHGFRGNS